MAVKTHPCADGLTAACFEADPQWAKQAFAFRLMSALVPASISRRLPKWKFSTFMIFPPGWTPGDPLPPGVTIDTSIFFPPGWTPGDPLPPGIIAEPGATFPPGWKPGDPLPPGFSIDPSVFFPPDWQPGDDLPDEIIWTPALPPEPDAPGPISPIFLDPTTPGPRPPYGEKVKKEYTTDIKSYALDGLIYNRDNSWSLCRAADTGDGNITTLANSGTCISAVHDFSGYYLERSFFEFPLTGIPAHADIISAVFRIHGMGNNDSKVCIQKGTFSGELSNDDFGAYSGWAIDVVDWTIFDIDPDLINEFTFSGTNLDWLESKFGGTASLCVREYDHDYQNEAPGAPITRYLNGCLFRDYLDQDKVPILRIVYEA